MFVFFFGDELLIGLLVRESDGDVLLNNIERILKSWVIGYKGIWSLWYGSVSGVFGVNGVRSMKLLFWIKELVDVLLVVVCMEKEDEVRKNFFLLFWLLIF